MTFQVKEKLKDKVVELIKELKNENIQVTFLRFMTPERIMP
jgi:hypothetical protein